jgi:hypothetical protein
MVAAGDVCREIRSSFIAFAYREECRDPDFSEYVCLFDAVY